MGGTSGKSSSKRVSASVSGNCMVCFSLQLAGIMSDPCSMPTLFHVLQPILAHMGAGGARAARGAGAGHARAGPRDRLARPPSATPLAPVGLWGARRARPLVAPAGPAARGQDGRVVGPAGLDGAGLHEPPTGRRAGG